MKDKLRAQAANERLTEEKARKNAPRGNLVEAIRRRIERLGGVDLPTVRRGPVRRTLKLG